MRTMAKNNWKTIKKYEDKVYRTFRTQLPIELMDEFTEKCADLGVSKNEIIRKGIEKYIDENKGD